MNSNDDNAKNEASKPEMNTQDLGLYLQHRLETDPFEKSLRTLTDQDLDEIAKEAGFSLDHERAEENIEATAKFQELVVDRAFEKERKNNACITYKSTKTSTERRRLRFALNVLIMTVGFLLITFIYELALLAMK